MVTIKERAWKQELEENKKKLTNGQNLMKVKNSTTPWKNVLHPIRRGRMLQSIECNISLIA